MKKHKIKLSTGRKIILAFAGAIILGTLLLLLPVSSRNGECCGLRTALFTATSSTCVTGLVLADTWTQWSGFGQIVLLALIETGGLGFMSAASIVVFLLRKKISLQQRMLMAESISAESGGVMRVQKNLLIGSIGAQAAGALALFIRFVPMYGVSRAAKLGIFHSVSAFCNAGFDIMGFASPGSSMGLFVNDYAVCLILSFLIIFGGLGFIVWDEIARVHNPKRWSVYTKLVLSATAALIISGWVLICITEWNNPSTLGNMSVPQKLLAGFFQSVTLRTAGFAAIDQGSLTEAGKAVSCFYMLIGGSSGSTAGGLKTVTLVVLLLFVGSRMRGLDHVSVFRRSISSEQVLNALTIAAMMITLAFAGGIIIAGSSHVSFIDALYEAVSALGTVGLTTGITPSLSLPSHILLIIYMFFGRVGLLTISLGFLKGRYTENEFRYAGTSLLIG